MKSILLILLATLMTGCASANVTDYRFCPTTVPPGANLPANKAEVNHWAIVRHTFSDNEEHEVEQFLNRYPSGIYQYQAQCRIKQYHRHLETQGINRATSDPGMKLILNSLAWLL